MAAMILLLAVAALWLEVAALRNIHRASLRGVQIAQRARPQPRIEDLLTRTAGEIAALLDLRSCWFEPFPFDALLPRIEHGRIVLPVPEPGIAARHDAGVELPVRWNGLTLGRFVLQPAEPTVGVGFGPTARDRALAMATEAAAPLAAALTRGDASLNRAIPARPA
jgi:hypothetical protein